MKLIRTTAALLFLSLSLGACAEENKQENPSAATDTVDVKVVTNHGEFTIELNAGEAPISVANFLEYVDADYYDGTVFHRIIPNFMIQGGGFKEGMLKKTTNAPIKNEADNGLKNVRGSIAMARTGDPHSGTSQFFINVVDNRSLDFSSKTSSGWGYAVFGKVTQGLDVVDKIRNVQTGTYLQFQNVPLQTVTIQSISRIAK